MVMTPTRGLTQTTNEGGGFRQAFLIGRQDALRRNLGMAVQALEGRLLPGAAAPAGMAAPLRGALSDRRGQQHLLPPPGGEGVRALEGGHARGFRLRAQDESLPDARQAAPRSWGAGASLHGTGAKAWSQMRARAAAAPA